MRCKALFLLLSIPICFQAQNLVPNWSFEDYEECPDGSGQIERASGWTSFRLTPDYFNACDESGQVGVPNSAFAENTPALDGDAYTGFIRNHNTGNSEVIGVNLNEALEVDSVYYLSFYVLRILYQSSFGTTDCWNDRIGARFSTVPYQDWPEDVVMPIDNYAHVYHNEMLETNGVWTKIEGYFQADSAYNYVGLGYHFDEDSMNIACAGDPFPIISYFFLDCVCVAKDPEMCPNCDLVSANTSAGSDLEILTYPNPFRDQIIIENANNLIGIQRIEVFNATGRMLVQKNIQHKNRLIIDSLASCSKGLYILVVEFENGTKRRVKLIKH